MTPVYIFEPMHIPGLNATPDTDRLPACEHPGCALHQCALGQTRNLPYHKPAEIGANLRERVPTMGAFHAWVKFCDAKKEEANSTAAGAEAAAAAATPQQSQPAGTAPPLASAAAAPPPQAPVGIDDGGTGRGGGTAENTPPAPAALAATAGTPSSTVSLVELVRLIKISVGIAIEQPMAPAINEAAGQLGLTCDGMSLKEKANAVAQELGLVERA